MATPKRKGAYGAGTLVKPSGRGRTWGIKWRENGERHYAGGYENKQKAADALEVITARMTAGLPGVIPGVAKATPRVTFASVVDDWFASRADAKSITDNRNRWEKHLAPLLAHRPIDSVTKGLIDELVTDLKAKELEPASVERVLYVLSAFYRWAIRKEMVTTNPVREYLASLERSERNAIRTQHDPRDTPFIDNEGDVVRLFKALPEPINVAYALSALAGLRPGEAVGVEWSDVDLKAAKLTVRRRVRHGRVDTPKSGRQRVMPLVPSLVSLLKGWRAKNPDAVLVVPSQRKTGRKTTKPRHLGPKAIAEALSAACKACKLPPLTFYEAGRHTFASLWVLRGLDIYRLSEILGHASVTTTERYAHLGKKAQESVLARADIKLAG